MADQIELTILMPCLNEAQTLARCIRKATNFLTENHINGEILIADNGSNDGSQSIAVSQGARVINVVEKGYGNALISGIKDARGKYIIMGDSDDSYDFSNLSPFLEKLRDGYDLVMGNRFKGGIAPGAMPILHKYLGNPVLSGLGRFFFHIPIGDFHCGLRGFEKEAMQRIGLKSSGMEFASEMVVMAALRGLKIAEVPTTLSLDGRDRPPHLNTWRDGWRHLRYLLMHSPNWLFLYPGLLVFIIGFLGMLYLLPHSQTFSGVTFDIHSLLYCSVMLTVGVQVMLFGIYAKMLSDAQERFLQDRILCSLSKFFTLERGLIFGSILCMIGLGGSIYAVAIWGQHSFGGLIPTEMMRLVIPSVTAMSVGVQIIFASFFAALMGLQAQ